MAQGSDPKRLADIRAALKRAKPGDVLSLEALALVWRTTKPRFVTTRNSMADFPDPSGREGNSYLYPARKALEAMERHESRHDALLRARQQRTNAILGRTRRRGRAANDDDGAHTVNELATLSRMRAEIEEQEREQGLYVPVAEIAAVAGDVFSEISDFMRGLSNKIDPHGLLSPEIRAQIDESSDEALLQLHRKMKDILSPDAKPRGSRTTSGKARRTRARR